MMIRSFLFLACPTRMRISNILPLKLIAILWDTYDIPFQFCTDPKDPNPPKTPPPNLSRNHHHDLFPDA